MPNETTYTDPVTGETLVDPRRTASDAPFDNRGYIGNDQSRVDPGTPGSRYPGDPAYTDDPNDPNNPYMERDADGNLTPRLLPFSHATVSELNELKMNLNSKHTSLAQAVGALSQNQTPTEFAAAKALVMNRAADIRNHVQGFKA